MNKNTSKRILAYTVAGILSFNLCSSAVTLYAPAKAAQSVSELENMKNENIALKGSIQDMQETDKNQIEIAKRNKIIEGLNKEKTMISCVQLDGFDAGKNFVFRIECLLDPEKPDDIYFGEIIRKD